MNQININLDDIAREQGMASSLALKCQIILLLNDQIKQLQLEKVELEKKIEKLEGKKKENETLGDN